MPEDDSLLKQFIKRTESENLRRSGVVRAHNRQSLIVVGIASAVALATYGYSLYKISRNRNLDASFDKLPDYEPARN